MKTILQLTDALAHRFTFVALSAALCLGARAAALERFELKDGDRVLFIGDTFFEREVEYGHIETRLTAAFPDRNITFRNLAWAADTPMGRSRASFDWNKSEDDWLKRVKEQVALVKPTVALLSYGMTAALEGGEAGIPRFKADLNRLMDAIEEISGHKVRFMLLGPIPHDLWQSEATAHNQILKLYEEATRELAESRPARFAGLTWAWPDAGEKELRLKHKRTDDGIHLNELGQNGVAVWIAMAFSRDAGNQDKVAFEVLRAAIRKKNELFFHRWRPANWTYLFGFRKYEQGQNAVEIPKFDPLIEEWEKRIAKLRDLKHQDPATVKEVTELIREAGVSPAAASTTKSEIKSQPLPTFDVADGFEVNLWAENPLLHKPIQMNWDPQGRLWIASSEVYPQIKPGQPATDSIVVLEDSDGDGKADKHTMFADGLLIPTGVVPDGKGGCYAACSHELLHFADTDGDGKADKRTIVLTSFGTEDTHHNLHTLRWGYDGHLYMNQSIYTHSHVETPHGVVRLNSGGIWRFNPDTWRLEIFAKGGCNPWGHHWDQWGNDFFTDGAGFKGVYHAMEGATYFTYSDMRREAESITPGNWPKFCSLELVHSPNFPNDWQGDAITCDFRAHRIVRFKLEENGSTFAGKEMPDLLRSTSVTFRPIDVRFGPDGALYVADWSNPIIQHGEVDFRDPRRDKEHGRIWRVTAKGNALAKKQDLRKLNATELLNRTLSKNGWEQEQARVVLRQSEPGKVLLAVKSWLARQTDPRARLEAMWLHEAFEKSADSLVGELAVAKDERLRAAAARVLANSN
jgi:glucose/arabinose dehydrogenase